MLPTKPVRARMNMDAMRDTDKFSKFREFRANFRNLIFEIGSPPENHTDGSQNHQNAHKK